MAEAIDFLAAIKPTSQKHSKDVEPVLEASGTATSSRVNPLNRF